MALKQMDALAALREAAGEVIETSLCDVQGSWLAAYSNLCASQSITIMRFISQCSKRAIND